MAHNRTSLPERDDDYLARLRPSLDWARTPPDVDAAELVPGHVAQAPSTRDAGGVVNVRHDWTVDEADAVIPRPFDVLLVVDAGLMTKERHQDRPPQPSTS